MWHVGFTKQGSLDECRKGVRSVVLESSPALRTSGFAFMTWTNAFRALDARGVGDKMRSHHLQVQGYVYTTARS